MLTLLLSERILIKQNIKISFDYLAKIRLKFSPFFVADDFHKGCCDQLARIVANAVEAVLCSIGWTLFSHLSK